MNELDDYRSDSSEERAQRIAYMINGYIRDNLTDSEHLELDGWVYSNRKNQHLFEELTDPVNLKKWIEWKEKLDTQAALERVQSKIQEHDPMAYMAKRRTWPYWVAAAAFLILFVLYGVNKEQRRSLLPVAVQSPPDDLLPGGKHATLNL